MTSNIGTDVVQKEAQFGFRVSSDDEKQELEQLHDNSVQKVTEELRGMLLPELINRIDKQIVFKALTREDAGKVLNIQFDELRARLMKSSIALRIKPNVKKYILDKGYDAKQGVRPLRRVIQDEIEDKLADALLSGDLDEGSTAEITAKKSGIQVVKGTE